MLGFCLFWNTNAPSIKKKERKDRKQEIQRHTILEKWNKRQAIDGLEEYGNKDDSKFFFFFFFSKKDIDVFYLSNAPKLLQSISNQLT